MPREPTLAEPHDRHPIKEYNDLPILRYFPACPPSQYPPSIPPSLPPFIPPSFPPSLSLYALWLISKLTCLSSSAAFQPKRPAEWILSSPHDWLRFDFENGQELFINCLPPLYICSEKRSSLPSLFISSTTSLSVILHFKPSWPLSEGARGAEEGGVTSEREWRLVCWFLKDLVKPVCSRGRHTDGLRAESRFSIKWYSTDGSCRNYHPITRKVQRGK